MCVCVHTHKHKTHTHTHTHTQGAPESCGARRAGTLLLACSGAQAHRGAAPSCLAPRCSRSAPACEAGDVPAYVRYVCMQPQQVTLCAAGLVYTLPHAMKRVALVRCPVSLSGVNAVKLCKQRVTDHGEERVVRQVEEEAFAALHEHVMRIVHDAPELLDGCPRLVVEFKGIPQRMAIVCSAPTHRKPVCWCRSARVCMMAHVCTRTRARTCASQRVCECVFLQASR